MHTRTNVIKGSKKKKIANSCLHTKNGQFLPILRKNADVSKKSAYKKKVMVQTDYNTILQWCQILARKNKYSKGYDILNFEVA